MPFNAVGVYTPATGATTAAPGTLIQSAIWNGIFTDISTALTLLGRQLYGSTSVTSSPYPQVSTDTLLLVNSSSTVSINLLAASADAGYSLTVKDISGAAHLHNITIIPHAGDTIEGAASLVITTDYGWYRLFPVTGGWILIP